MRVLIATVLLLCTLNVKAQQDDINYITAGDLSYVNTGTDTYRFTYVIYTECSNEFWDLTSTPSYLLYYKSEALGLEGSFEVAKNSNKIRGERVNIYCDSEPSNCDDPNGYRGLTKFEYSGSITLPGKSNDWLIFSQENLRTEALSNSLEDVALEPFYTEVTINNSAGGNDSPQFVGEFGPIARAFVGEETVFDLEMNDPDGDRLEYSIVSPKNTPVFDVTYSSGLDEFHPADGLTVSVDADGKLTMNATEDGKAGITTVRIDEYRGNNLVGSSTRDIQVSTFISDNNAPVVQGFFGTDTTVTDICVGQSLTEPEFEVIITDPDTDRVNIRVLSVVKDGATGFLSPLILSQEDTLYKIRFLNAMTASHIGQYVVTVEIEDEGCPFARTTTQELIINVRQIPQFDLGNDELFECNNPFTLTPNVVAEVEPLTYKWELYQWNHPVTKDSLILQDDNPVGGDQPSFDIENSAVYKLTVVDAVGCQNSDYIDFRTGIIAGFDYEKYCADSMTIFIDTSTTEVGNIVDWEWDFGDGSPVVTGDATPEYMYGLAGQYIVTLTVTNDVDCKGTHKDTITICPTQIPRLDINNRCARNNGTNNAGGDVTLYNDLNLYNPFGTLSECELKSRKWKTHKLEIDEITQDTTLVLVEQSPFIYPYVKQNKEDRDISNSHSVLASDPTFFNEAGLPDSGYYKVSLEVEGFSSCTHLADSIYYAHPRPEIRSNIKDFYINCDNPDSLLHVVVHDRDFGYHVNGITSYEILYNGFNVIKSGQFDIENTDTLFFDTGDHGGAYGLYSFRIIDDSTGCDHYWSTEIEFPIEVDFQYYKVCTQEDSMQFLPLDNVKTNVDNYLWNFGDGKTSNEHAPKHYYVDKKDYNVTYTVTDTNGCTKSAMYNVWNSLPVERFEILPNEQVTRICVGDPVIGRTYYYDVDADSAKHINYIEWDFGEGTKQTFSDQTSTSRPASGISVDYEYKTPGEKFVYNKVLYNRHLFRNVKDDEFCEADSVGKTLINVGEEFKGNIRAFNRCLGDSADVEFLRDLATRHIAIDSSKVEWIFVVKGNSGSSGVTYRDTLEKTNEVNPRVYMNEQTFTVDTLDNIAMEMIIKVQDINGCVFEGANDFRVQSVEKGWIEYDTACANEHVPLNVFAELQQLRYYFVLGGDNFQDTISYKSPHVHQEPSIKLFDRINYSFEENGDHDIKLYLGKELQEPGESYRYQCRSVLDTTISVYEIPKPNFTADKVCAVDDTTKFTNLSTMSDMSKIVGYLWDFGDGSTSDLENPGHVFQNGGDNMVTLTVYTDDGCAHDTTIATYVKYKPEADFELDTQFPEAEVPITFYDMSTSGTAIDYWEWDFDDMTPRVIGEQNPVHTYDTVLIYFPSLIVENVEGCRDTISKRTDLNVYLDLPTAFSPNDDQNNDELSLIHKSIKELYIFRIYNRYGEIVFDAEGDLNKVWDGTFKGKLQEVGTYVAHVQALGAYDTEFNFKRNVTLLR